ncbi:MAG: hypothetical protein AWM53_00667 [Candidatus Dichloromethanomonas elyunquensis]|nr:MAG: hypothetical protein AWM53_00667 [Candidatus Dichloromethanomonas elyunquensis]
MSDEINNQEEMDEAFDIIVLNDDEGHEHEFMHLATVELEGNTYFVLLPVEETEEDGEEAEAIILKVSKDENGEDMLMDIEDDEEWEKVADAWEEMEDNFEEEE